MAVDLFAVLILTIVLVAWLVLFAYVHYNNWMLWKSWRLRGAAPIRPPLPEELPRVTVQLPVYNEPAVVERLLEAVGALDYPRERLDIQLLDDSTDETPGIAARVVAELRASGLSIEHVRRATRDGYKAGALRDGLATADGELLLLLDADFVPPPDLLRRLVPWMSDPNVAMAQARWGRLREPRTLVERCAGYWIERHFEIEQLARSRAGHFFHFNGSGGLWRREAIEDAGGWQSDTVAEDLDLSFRAWRQRWRFVYDHDTEVPAELPADAAALRIQQGRWARGAFQVTRKAWPRLRELPAARRLQLTLHLSGYTFPVLLFLIALIAGPAAWARERLPLYGFLAADLPAYCFLAGLLVQVIYRWLRGGPRAGLLEVEAASLGLGLAPLVLMSGLRGLRQRGGTFHRTPKSIRGAGGLDRVVVTEICLALMVLAGAAFAAGRGAWPFVPLSLLAAVGLLTFAFRTAFPGALHHPAGAGDLAASAPGVAS
jgi:cellulose synthase/poly-beta-1,6-N-acetylglucosamine synthase-like glycosyltransferase